MATCVSRFKCYLLLKQTLRTLGTGRYLLFLLAILGFGAMSFAPPELFRWVSEGQEAISSISLSDFLKITVYFMVVVTICLVIASLGTTICQEWLGAQVEINFRKVVLRRLQDVPLPVDGTQRGEWVTRLTEDIANVETFVADTIPHQVRNLTILLGTGALFLMHAGWVATIPLGVSLFLALVNLRIQKRLSPLLSGLRTLHGGAVQLLIEGMEGIRSLRTVRREAQSRFAFRLSELPSKAARVARYLGMALGSNEFAAQSVITFCLSFATWELSPGIILAQDIFLYPLYIGLFFGAAQGLAGGFYEWSKFHAEGSSLVELLDDDIERYLHRLWQVQIPPNDSAFRL